MIRDSSDLRASSRRALAGAHGVHVGMSLFLAWRISDRNFADALSEFELTPRQYNVLLSLAADQPLSQTELVNRVGVDRSGMGRQIDDLEQRGLVERHRNEADRRAHAVNLTGLGRTCLKDADAAVQRTMAEVYGVLSEEELQVLDRLLTRIVEQH
ncbi:MarR family winged helix-turn-helix transcriptional regulator [Streptomyces sp. NPDC088116]|uniref:MarR family winged helix-turn-helix transcriptional regulator n=1 Tax=Streptomyces sp. NPDC088116 TaxID=3365825 RepID=UPI003814110E